MREKVVKFMHALNRIDVVYYMREKDSTITDAELCVLYSLDDRKAHTQAELCREWSLPKTTVSSIMKRWESEGLVTRDDSSSDKRQRHMKLTKKGISFAKKHLTPVYEAEEKALSKTIEKYGEDFIEAVLMFGEQLKSELL
ncbi:MAG: MarR family transcriptional regulator [Lachnospiraceae bacterium]|nr:MarR family transcriptional regulator [Lachnospiraceae bacterium]